jgi:hypothetical protein
MGIADHRRLAAAGAAACTDVVLVPAWPHSHIPLELRQLGVLQNATHHAVSAAREVPTQLAASKPSCLVWVRVRVRVRVRVVRVRARARVRARVGFGLGLGRSPAASSPAARASRRRRCPSSPRCSTASGSTCERVRGQSLSLGSAFGGLAGGYERAGAAAQEEGERPGPWLWQEWPCGAAAAEGGRRVNRLEGTALGSPRRHTPSPERWGPGRACRRRRRTRRTRLASQPRTSSHRTRCSSARDAYS